MYLHRSSIRRWLQWVSLGYLASQAICLPVMAQKIDVASETSRRYYEYLGGAIPNRNGTDGPGFSELAPLPDHLECKYGPSGGQYDPRKLIRYISQSKKEWDTSSTAGQSTPLLLSAHRGVHGRVYPEAFAVPENSMQAIIEAGHRNFEMIELDVHMDADGKLRLMHDYTIGRTAVNTYSAENWDPLIDPPSQKVNGMWQGSFSLTNSFGGGGYNSNYYLPSKILPTGYLDFSQGIPLIHEKVKKLNPALSKLKEGDFDHLLLRGFDRDTNSWEHSFDERTTRILTLEEALKFIGENYPGMVVVLDLRHKAEVEAAIKAINVASTCDNNVFGKLPAKDWVVLKPFANVYPAGLKGIGDTLEAHLPKIWKDYLWIPVLSGRMLSGAKKGDPSVYPGGLVGPDINTISIGNTLYLDNWLKNPPSPKSIVGFEVSPGTDPKVSLLQYAYDIGKGLAITSWRPPDVRNYSDQFTVWSKSSSCTDNCRMGEMLETDRLTSFDGSTVYFPVDNYFGKAEKDKCQFARPITNSKQAVIGYNFKDDGLGKYPVTLDGYTCLSEVMNKAQIFTIDDGHRVMHALRGETRDTDPSITYQEKHRRRAQLRPLLANSYFSID